MRPIGNYEQVQSSNGRAPIPAGGYVCKIIEVTDNTNNEFFKVVYDIEEGEEKGRYADEWGQQHPWAHQTYVSYKESALPMFKGFIQAVEESNGVVLEGKVKNGTLSPADLNGKLVGFIIGYEEYRNDEGEVKQSAKVRSSKSIQQIRAGRFRVPELKKLKVEDQVAPGFTQDADLPF